MATYTIQASGIVRQLTGVALGSGGYPGVALYEWTDASGVGAEVSGTTVSSSVQGHWSVSTTGGDTTKKYVVKLWNREDTNQVRYVPITESHTFQSVNVGSGATGVSILVGDGRIQINNDNGNDKALDIHNTASGAVGTFQIYTNGYLSWTDGTSEDTNLYRSAAHNLMTDDSLTLKGNLSVSGTMTVTGAVTLKGGATVTGVATVGTLAATAAVALPTGSVTASMIANRTRSFLVQPVAFSGPGGFFSIGASYALPMAQGSEVIARGWFITPPDYSSNLSVGAMVEAVETGTAYAKMDAIFGAEGESIPEGTSPNHSVTSNWISVPIVATSITNLCNITLSSVSAGDVVCVTFDRNGSVGQNINISTLGFYGFIVNYVADS